MAVTGKTPGTSESEPGAANRDKRALRPSPPFQKLAASFEATARTEAREGGATEIFDLERDPALIAVELAHGAPPCLSVRAHEEEAAPSSGYRKNVLTRMRARLVYPTLSIRRLTPLERFNAMFALRIDVRTGDPAFDREVALTGDLSDEVIATAFGAPETRAAVLQILAAGFNVYFEERAVRAQILGAVEGHLTATTLGPVIEGLTALVTHVPRFEPTTLTKRPQLGRAITVGILVTGLVAAAALAPGTLDDPGIPVRPIPRPLLPLPTMAPGILAGTVAFVLAFALLRWQLKRRNAATDLPIVLALFVVMGTLGVGLLDAANRLLDDAPLAVHEARVVGKDTGKSRKSGQANEWMLVIPAWQPGATQLELVVDAELHRTIRTGDTLRVTVHPGFFGWEWGAVLERARGAAPAPGNHDDGAPDAPDAPGGDRPNPDRPDPDRPGRDRPSRP